MYVITWLEKLREAQMLSHLIRKGEFQVKPWLSEISNWEGLKEKLSSGG